MKLVNVIVVDSFSQLLLKKCQLTIPIVIVMLNRRIITDSPFYSIKYLMVRDTSNRDRTLS